MNIKNFLTSENTNILIIKLIESLNLDRDEKTISACKKLIKLQMSLVYEKNKEKILSGKYDIKKILVKLNDKTIKECIKIYKNKISKKIELIDDDTYTELSNNNSQYITATGEISKKMVINHTPSIGRKNAKEELDKELILRKTQYQSLNQPGAIINNDPFALINYENVKNNISTKPSTQINSFNKPLTAKQSKYNFINNIKEHHIIAPKTHSISSLRTKTQPLLRKVSKSPSLSNMQSKNISNLSSSPAVSSNAIPSNKNIPYIPYMPLKTINTVDPNKSLKNNNSIQDNKSFKNSNTVDQNIPFQNSNTIKPNIPFENSNTVDPNKPFQNSNTIKPNIPFENSNTVNPNKPFENNNIVDLNKSFKNKNTVDPNKSFQNSNTIKLNIPFENKNTVDPNKSFNTINLKEQPDISFKNNKKYLIVGLGLDKDIVDGMTYQEIELLINSFANIENTGNIEYTPNIENTGNIKYTPNIENTGNIEYTQNIENTRNIEYTQNIENTGNIEYTPNIENTGNIEYTVNTVNTENNINTRNIESTAYIENIEYTPNIENLEYNVNSGNMPINKFQQKINSCEWTESCFYNNYKINFNQDIKCITKIEIKNAKFPELHPIIDDMHNNIRIIQDNMIIPIELSQEEDYTIEEMIDSINSALDENNILVEIINVNGWVTFKSKNNKIFSLDLENNSFACYFGFTGKQYNGRTEYKSDNKHEFYNDYYLYINELSDQPILSIKNDGTIKQLIDNIGKKTINQITLKFLKDNNNYVNFNDESHVFDFILDYVI